MAESDSYSCKVGRVADRYDLANIDGDLPSRYADDASLRDLEALVNKRILRTAIERADGGTSTLAGSDRGVDALYEVLRTDKNASPAERARVRTRLEQAGIDVDAVTDDWVSHATVRTHLNDCLAMDTSREASLTPEEAISTVEWTRSRSERIVSETVQRLRTADVAEVTEPTVSVSVRITCEVCGRSYTIQDLLDEGGCACHDENSQDGGRE